MALTLAGTRELHDDIELSSGRKISANNYILGLPAFGKIWLNEGYDGQIEHEDGEIFWDKTRGDLTLAERTEIAEHMIGRWREWAGDTDTTQDRGDQGLG